MGGSILPATIYNNKLYFLFGKEREIDENPGWSDFGGGTENGESFFDTAIREGSEELTGFLGNSSDIKKLLNKYGTYNIDFKSHGHSTYRAHIFPMKHDDYLPHYYNNNQRFLQEKLNPSIIKDSKVFEKTQIKWFSIADMKRDYSKFRSFYKNIVSLILKNNKNINTFVRRSLNKEKGKKKTKKFVSSYQFKKRKSRKI